MQQVLRVQVPSYRLVVSHHCQCELSNNCVTSISTRIVLALLLFFFFSWMMRPFGLLASRSTVELQPDESSQVLHLSASQVKA
jgi:hypothetical protein